MTNPQPNFHELDGAVSRLEKSVPSPDAAWAGKITSGDFQNALSSIEEVLATNPSDSTARLWWIQCQLAVEAVPMTALSAPLEQMVGQLRTSESLSALSCLTYLKVARRLAERKQLRVAVPMFERAIEFGRINGTLLPEEGATLTSVLRRVIDEEIERAELRRENKDYISGLRTKAAGLKSQTFPAPKPASASRRNGLSAKAILAQAAEDGTALNAELADKIAIGAAGEAAQWPADEKFERRESQWRKKISAALSPIRNISPKTVRVTLGSLAIVVLAFWYLTRVTDDELLSRIAMNIESEASAALVLPAPRPRGSSGNVLSTNLESLQERLTKMEEKLPKVVGDDGATENNPSATSPSLPQEVNTAPIAPVVETGREKLPTGGADVRDLDKVLVGSNATRDDVSKDKPLSDSASQNHQVADSELKYGKDGRLYGPPKDVKDGSSRGHEVKEFDKPVMFRIIAPTDVYSAPSLMAVSLAQLDVNAKVQVISRMGHWLELRSQEGRRGYIYAQDAEEVR